MYDFFNLWRLAEGSYEFGSAVHPSVLLSACPFICPKIFLELVQQSFYLSILQSARKFSQNYPNSFFLKFRVVLRVHLELSFAESNYFGKILFRQKLPKIAWWDIFKQLGHQMQLKLVEKITDVTARFCKNYISRKILAQKLQATMLQSNQIVGFFDPQYVLKESINILQVLHGCSHQVQYGHACPATPKTCLVQPVLPFVDSGKIARLKIVLIERLLKLLG